MLSLAFWGGCSVQEGRDSSKISKAQNEKIELERKIDKQDKDYAEKLLAEQTDKQKKLADIDEKNTKEVERAKKEYDRTIADLRAGNLQLRQRFTCPKANSPVPSAGVDNGQETGGLQVQDGEFLVSEAERADSVARQLTAAQEVIDELLKKKGK